MLNSKVFTIAEFNFSRIAFFPFSIDHQSVQASSKAAVMQLLKESPGLIENMQTTFVANFPSEPLSATRSKFIDSDGKFLASNSAVETCCAVTLDVTDSTQHMLAVLEHYVRINIPKMEDGNNFGVTVQLAALKQVNDAQDKLAKAIDDVVKYASARADAIEKCKLPTESQTKTTSNSTSDSKTEGDEPKNSKEAKSSTETKSTNTTTNFCESDMRKNAVIFVDLQYYSKLKNLYRLAMTEYISALDFLEKNSQKIDQPRGSRDGSGSAYSSMY